MAPPLPMLGVAPPPVGPRMPNPLALADLRAGISKLLDAAEKDPLVGRALNPIIRTLMDARTKLMSPPKPSRDEAPGSTEPLDQTPQGDVGGTPLSALLPQILGAGTR